MSVTLDDWGRAKMKICVVVGNPKPDSRTLDLTERLAHMIGAKADSYELTTIDLARHSAEMFAWPSASMAALNEEAATSDLLIVGSPTYKATYTGLLKSFLDRYPALGLRGVCAIPVMTGAGKGHSMAPEVNLRPLLVELGAIVPTRGLYFETPNMEMLDEFLAAWLEDNRLALGMVLAAAATGQEAAL
jgi:FMN reductase